MLNAALLCFVLLGTSRDNLVPTLVAGEGGGPGPHCAPGQFPLLLVPAVLLAPVRWDLSYNSPLLLPPTGDITLPPDVSGSAPTARPRSCWTRCVGAERSSVLGPEQARGRVESGSLDEGRSFLMQ